MKTKTNKQHLESALRTVRKYKMTCAEAGRLGGQATSDAKTKAVRKNARLGGRGHKRKPTE